MLVDVGALFAPAPVVVGSVLAADELALGAGMVVVVVGAVSGEAVEP